MARQVGACLLIHLWTTRRDKEEEGYSWEESELPGCVRFAATVELLSLGTGAKIGRGILGRLSGKTLPAVRIIENAVAFLEGLAGLRANTRKAGGGPIGVF